MERVVKPAGKLVGAFAVVIALAVGLYLFALLQVYIIGWVVQLIQAVFG
jgi:ABC-type uncharacterized transport system permease subunit